MKDTRMKIRVYFILFVFLNCLNGNLVTAGGFGAADGGTGFGKWDTPEVEEVEEEKVDEYPELYLEMAKSFSMYRNDPLFSHATYSFYPEVTGWYVFQTYGHVDTVMEIYREGVSIVDEGESDGDRGEDNNELQHKYLEAHERITVQVYLHSKYNKGPSILNVRVQEPRENLHDPLKLGYAKRFFLSTDVHPDTHFTTKFTPEYTGWYNIETYSHDEDTVMEIYHPDGYSMVASGESDGDRGVDNEELQVKYFEAGKTYTIQVYMQDSDNNGFAWVHVWRSLYNPLDVYKKL